MKWLLLVTFSFSIQAQDSSPSLRMSNLLEESGVLSWGKRQERDARITCKMPRRKAGLRCTLATRAIDDAVLFRPFKGQEAIIVSNLLMEFGSYPEGKRQRQELRVICKTRKGSKTTECQKIEPDEMGFY